MHSSTATALAALIVLSAPTVKSHSWIEELWNINPSNMSFTGAPGYMRNFTKRTANGFTDPLNVHILPGQGQPSIEQRDSNPALETTGINHNDTVCKLTQQKPFQTDTNPRLAAAPGALVALLYTENGHVTLPQNQVGKAPNSGTVFIYGTTDAQSRTPDLFLDVFGQWTADGTGGNKRGKLLATQNFNDGRCYQINGGEISQQRQKQYPHVADPVFGTDLPCQNDIALPTDIPIGQPYTLYWIWSWGTLPGKDPNLPNGKTEIYTSCADIDIIAKPPSKRRVKGRQAQSPSPSAGSVDLNSAAIPAYVSSLMASPAPAGATAAVSAPAPKTDATTPAAQVPATNSAPVVQVPTPNSAAVVSYIQNAVSAGVAAGIAAKDSKVPATVTVDIMQSSVPAATQSASPIPVTPAATRAASQAPVPAPSMPPKSLDINPPVLVSASTPASPAISGTASPVVASPVVASPVVASPVVASPAVASPAIMPSGAYQNGTAAAASPSVVSGGSQNGTAEAKSQGCSAQNCQSKRQSKIFSRKSGGQRL